MHAKQNPSQYAPPPSPLPAELPHYTDDEWDWLRGALATVDRDYGWLLNTMHHHIQVGAGQLYRLLFIAKATTAGLSGAAC